jgi:hypothetical protein
VSATLTAGVLHLCGGVVTVRIVTPPGRFGPTVESGFRIRDDLVSARLLAHRSRLTACQQEIFVTKSFLPIEQ